MFMKTPFLVVRTTSELEARVCDYLSEAAPALDTIVHIPHHWKGEAILLFCHKIHEFEGVSNDFVSPTLQYSQCKYNTVTIPSKFFNSLRIEPAVHSDPLSPLTDKSCPHDGPYSDVPETTKPYNSEKENMDKEVQNYRTQNAEYNKAYTACLDGFVAMTTLPIYVLRMFESGVVQLATHTSSTIVEMQKCFSREVHPYELQHPDNTSNQDKREYLRVRGKLSVRDALIKHHKLSCQGENEMCILDPTTFTKVLAVVELKIPKPNVTKKKTKYLKNEWDWNHYLLACTDSSFDFPTVIESALAENDPKTALNRAEYKIAESFDRSKLIAETPKLDQGIALDIGASPGGWTAFLAKRCKKVVAVDAAELRESVTALPNVTHVKALLLDKTLGQGVLAEDGLENLDKGVFDKRSKMYDATYEQIAAEAPKGVSVVTCDINRPIINAVQISLRSLPLIAPGAIFVVTVKYKTRNPLLQKQHLEEAKKLLAPFCDRTEEAWFFANTFNERTLLARYAGPQKTTT
eukprot:m.342012 g.342012  ORF g.342012 m.342012 type:complete len:520 (-) comp20794_c0_seq1:136-1695(-)